MVPDAFPDLVVPPPFGGGEDGQWLFVRTHKGIRVLRPIPTNGVNVLGDQPDHPVNAAPAGTAGAAGPVGTVGTVGTVEPVGPVGTAVLGGTVVAAGPGGVASEPCIPHSFKDGGGLRDPLQ